MHDRASQVLRAALGPDATFREGQLDAIEALAGRHERLLVVQRTGWGKSSVYFVTTRLLREQGAGPTILVSPLLALMRDQVRAAERFGVAAVSIDSTNMHEWDEIEAAIRLGVIDLLLVSPERLANPSFVERVLEPLLPSVGLFVVDEAHCISDWGHDFRPDYRRIRGILPRLAPDAAVLATTATANDDVVQDVAHQLGGDVQQLRGPLSRASLRLQATHIPSEAARMAWLAERLASGELAGSGIVYVLTRAHASRIAAFLVSKGIDAAAYTGGGAPGSKAEVGKLELERRLLANDIKAIVATPALGMGFDKPDLAWVVHFQMPQSLVHYYQQVGRAGRAVDDAVGVLLHGEGDRRITDYFIAQAFPPPATYEHVLAVLRRASPLAVSVTEIAKRARVGRALTEKVLGQLAVEAVPPVAKLRSGWRSTGAPFELDQQHMADLAKRRHAEYDRILHYARGEQCYMVHVAEELDDPTAEPCGRCAVCVGRPIVGEQVAAALVSEAEGFTPPKAVRGRRPKRPPKTTARVKKARRKK